MGRYAQNTEVSSDRSKAEIERTLIRYGAVGFAYGWEGDIHVVQFKMRDRYIRFRLPMPARSEFAYSESGRSRTSQAAIDSAWEQAQRQRWRALLLVIKAKLEAVEAGITDFEHEFMSAMVLPGAGGRTVGDMWLPVVDESYRTGTLPALMPGLSPDLKQLVEGGLGNERG